MNIYELALNLFRPIVVKRSDKLNKLSNNLKRAHFTKFTAEEYFAFAILLSIIAYPVSLAVVLFFIIVSGLTLRNLLLGVSISLLVSAGTGFITLYYPKTLADARKKKIENSLSFATLYLTTMAESAILPKDMFKLMGGLKEYGAIADEARRISEDIEGVGLDFPSAVDRAIRRSPSVEWSEFLSGFKTTIVSGGELKSYLEEKTRGYTEEYKERLISFGKMLTMLLQMYLTIVGIGTVFFIVISSLMGVIGGVSTTMVKVMQYLVVLGGIPLMTVAMIIIIRMISPLSVK
ncbi:MAG: type II secretion system F family protein [Candidatus Woesearchaeota archaeon]|nr:MAG: type II secretion system F family protein [Candidatus Woesearchaeota archaeon]